MSPGSTSTSSPSDVSFRLGATDRFPEGILSMAAVTLTPTPDGGTELVLVHRGVPKDLIPETEQAWRDQYWSRIKAYLDRRAG